MTAQKQKLLINSTRTNLQILSTNLFFWLQNLLRGFLYCSHCRGHNLSRSTKSFGNFNTYIIPIDQHLYLSQPWTLEIIAALDSSIYRSSQQFF